MKRKRKSKKIRFFSRKKSGKKLFNFKKFKRKKPDWKEFLRILVVACCLSLFVLYAKHFLFSGEQLNATKMKEIHTEQLEITEDFLTVNEYSRPAIALTKVKGIVVHYVANPGSTAKENRDYFEGLRTSHVTKASSHFIIGLDGEIIQCIPLNEISYASNDRNYDTISIECCHPKEDGKFTEATYDALVRLVSDLCVTYDLKTKNIIRHYDVTGKLCPRYYVEHPDAWKQFRLDVKNSIKKQENK